MIVVYMRYGGFDSDVESVLLLIDIYPIMRVCGLDISSSAVGWCVLDCNGTNMVLIDCGFIKPSKVGSIFDRLESVEKQVGTILDKYRPDQVGIEDIAKFFPGKSSATTIITLALFNRTIGLSAHKKGYVVKLHNVMAIRHGIKLTKELPKKEAIPELVAGILGIKFPYKLNKKSLPVKENNDTADAIAVAIYHWKKEIKP